MIINPKGFGGDVVRWTDQMTILLGKNSSQVPRLDDPNEWRQWALGLARIVGPVGRNVPDPFRYDNWEEWAERLFNTQEFSG